VPLLQMEQRITKKGAHVGTRLRSGGGGGVAAHRWSPCGAAFPYRDPVHKLFGESTFNGSKGHQVLLEPLVIFILIADRPGTKV
jgi:hypothetical protein